MPIQPQASSSHIRTKRTSYGRHLAQECSGCHRIDGVDNGIPALVGYYGSLPKPAAKAKK